MTNSSTISIYGDVFTEKAKVQQLNRYCAICLWLVIILVGAFGLLYGSLGAMAVGITGFIPGSGFPPYLPLGVGGLLFLLGAYMLLVGTLRKESMMKRIIGVAISHEKISIDDISRQSGVKLPRVRPLLFEAISEGRIEGTVKENMFVREKTKPGETVRIEREVMITRKTPDACFKCGASLNPQEVEWVGPDQVRCPHCGATMAVETERI
jgi:ribosomal protein S27AE